VSSGPPAVIAPAGAISERPARRPASTDVILAEIGSDSARQGGNDFDTVMGCLDTQPHDVAHRVSAAPLVNLARPGLQSVRLVDGRPRGRPCGRVGQAGPGTDRPPESSAAATARVNPIRERPVLRPGGARLSSFDNLVDNSCLLSRHRSRAEPGARVVDTGDPHGDESSGTWPPAGTATGVHPPPPSLTPAPAAGCDPLPRD
jgi:hypothetical protein